MRRGTPSAELFGGLLALVRMTGTGSSMRQVGDKLGAPAATVSQIEKGQRALKQPKIAGWAAALAVSEADLSELWMLSQGQIAVGDRFVFYSDRPDLLGAEPLRDDIVKTIREQPDLEPIYRLAERIAAVLQRILPRARIEVDLDDYEPLFIDQMDAGTITAAQEKENEEHAAAWLPLPIIWFHWGRDPDRRTTFLQRDGVRVPLLEELAPIVRRRGKSVAAVELEDLLRDLSGPERERVRGYVEAIVEQRADPKG